MRQNTEYRMRSDLLPNLGQSLLEERRRRGLNQADLAARVGRAPARISELERDLRTNRLGKDRFTLLAEICDALDLVMTIAPRDQVLERVQSPKFAAAIASGVPPSVFDEVFVDLSDEEQGVSDGKGAGRVGRSSD